MNIINVMLNITFKKAVVIGRQPSLQKSIEVIAKKYFKISKQPQKPDFVIACGGEGTLLWSELIYPGVPKLFFIFRREKITTAGKRVISAVLAKLNQKKIKIVQLPKLEAIVNGKKRIVGMNEINIHYTPPIALRLRVSARNKKIDTIGDGLVVATPYGSEAYFKSITRRNFATGIGVAFNNPTKPTKPLFVPETEKIKVVVLRRVGVVVADCDPHLIKIKEGDKIIIRKVRNVTKVIKLSDRPLKISL